MAVRLDPFQNIVGVGWPASGPQEYDEILCIFRMSDQQRHDGGGLAMLGMSTDMTRQPSAAWAIKTNDFFIYRPNFTGHTFMADAALKTFSDDGYRIMSGKMDDLVSIADNVFEENNLTVSMELDMTALYDMAEGRYKKTGPFTITAELHANVTGIEEVFYDIGGNPYQCDWNVTASEGSNSQSISKNFDYQEYMLRDAVGGNWITRVNFDWTYKTLQMSGLYFG